MGKGEGSASAHEEVGQPGGHLLPHLLAVRLRLNGCKEGKCRNYLEKRGDALTLLDALADEASEPRDRKAGLV